VVTVEYALMLIFGVLPLLLLTFTGVMIFAAKQTLELAAAEGARASLRYGTIVQRQNAACLAASESMQWLTEFTGEPAACPSAAAPIAVTPIACTGNAAQQCMQVTVSYDYAKHPFLPGTVTLYGWAMGNLTSTAVAQLDLGD
jgi:hypothetical protein